MAAVYRTLSRKTARKRNDQSAASSARAVNGHAGEQTDIAMHDAPTDGTDGAAKPAGPKFRQRVLILSSRGVTYRHRHLLNDLYSLMPHSRKDAKLDTKAKLYQLNELADLYNCNNVLFFEARKGRDLYVWMSKPPNGPTVKMHLQNLHTMEELHFSGNCLKGSRPILSFDSTFNGPPHLKVVKELLMHVFAVPKSSRKVKPFVDHVIGFTVADGKIWVRCYQINETEQSRQQEGDQIAVGKATGKTELSLIEIGPRFVLTPIVILESSFGGPVIYENKEFVSPNQIRSDLRRARAAKHHTRAEQGSDRKSKKADLGLTSYHARKKDRDELDDRVLFG